MAEPDETADLLADLLGVDPERIATEPSSNRVSLTVAQARRLLGLLAPPAPAASGHWDDMWKSAIGRVKADYGPNARTLVGDRFYRALVAERCFLLAATQDASIDSRTVRSWLNDAWDRITDMGVM